MFKTDSDQAEDIHPTDGDAVEFGKIWIKFDDTEAPDMSLETCVWRDS